MGHVMGAPGRRTEAAAICSVGVGKGFQGSTLELHPEEREGLSVKMLWEEKGKVCARRGKFVPRQKGMREPDGSKKWG